MNAITTGLAAVPVDSAPGRACPLYYRYSASGFNHPAAADFSNLEVLYVVGGLYGNELALAQVARLFAQETGRKRMVFNGDFHWFDADAAWFERVQTQVLSFGATRGNVETELAQAPGGGELGCGCAYPHWVDDAVVSRSNRIMGALRTHPTECQRAVLAQLPMWLRADVGGFRVAVVHGDAESLAGWGFAPEHLRQARYREQAGHWLQVANVDAFACSHTCLPTFRRLQAGARVGWVLNNGAAGMPNLQGDRAGLFTRIALSPFAGAERRFGAMAGPVFLDAIAIPWDTDAWLAQFETRWPPGSDAYVSYHHRMTHSLPWSVQDALQLED